MPNRAPELDWEEPTPAPEPGGLNRAVVVRTAVALADAEGIAAVSIRRVAHELGARPMSLYTHIASKDDLIDLMINEVLAEVLVPEPLPADWREALRHITHHSYRAFVAHPWVLEAFGWRARLGPNALRHGEQSAAAVASLGLEPEAAWTLLTVVDDYMLGHAVRVSSLARRGPHDLPEIDAGRYPQLAAIAGAREIVPAPDAFDRGLEAVLDGIEARFLR